MNIESVPFKAEHMIEISEHIIEKTYTPEQWRQWAKFNEKTCEAITVYVDGEILACAGIRLEDIEIDGEVQLEKNAMWVVLHERTRQHKRELLYATRIFVNHLAENRENEKITAICCCSFDEGHTFMEHIGFRATGTQRLQGFDDYELERPAA